MKTRMKISAMGIMTAVCVMAAGTVWADRGGRGRGHGYFGRGPAPRCAPRHGGSFFGLALGFALPPPIIVAPVPAPVIVTPSGYWADREERVWVEGLWVETTDVWGRRVRTQEPGHWEIRRTRVWVSY